MIAKADVLVENFAPGTLERLGLGWAVAREHNPRLVYASGSGYGSDGRISEATFTFYVWKKRYGGIGPSELRRLRQLAAPETSQAQQGSAAAAAQATGSCHQRNLEYGFRGRQSV